MLAAAGGKDPEDLRRAELDAACVIGAARIVQTFSRLTRRAELLPTVDELLRKMDAMMADQRLARETRPPAPSAPAPRLVIREPRPAPPA